MNVFFVDKNPRIAAQSLVDQHVSKMVCETAQILSNCYTLDRLASPTCPRTKKNEPRKHSYPHHPCCKWARESLGNFYWLISHGHWLEQEREHRGMEMPHFSYAFIEWCAFNPPNRMIGEELVRTEPAQAFGKDHEYLRCSDPVEGYRAYYNVAKRNQETLKKVWTNRQPPEWWWIKDGIQTEVSC